MKFLPFETVTYQTKITEEEITKRLSDCIDTKNFLEIRLISYEKSEKSYEGEINKQKFRMRRISDNIRNTPPFIIGSIENNLDKTIITVKIRPSIGYLIWMGTWFTLVTVFFFFYTLSNPFDFFTILLMSFIIFAYVRTIFKFSAESSWAKADLEGLLEAEEI